MRVRRLVLAVAATVGFGLAVVVVAFMVAVGRPSRRPTSSPASAAWLGASSAGKRRGLVSRVEGVPVAAPQSDLGWCADDAFGYIDRLGHRHGGGAQRAGLLLDARRHRGLQHRQLDGAAGLHQEGLAAAG